MAGSFSVISPFVGVIAGLAAICFYGFQVWESKTVRGRLRLHRRNRYARERAAHLAEATALLIRQKAEANALITQQAAEAAALIVKHGGQDILEKTNDDTTSPPDCPPVP